MEASESPSVTMKKIRINELARELEVKPGAILDLLPELGVAEKKTHSSSVDEDVAELLRKRLIGSDVERYVHPPRGEEEYEDHTPEAVEETHGGAPTVKASSLAEPVSAKPPVETPAREAMVHTPVEAPPPPPVRR